MELKDFISESLIQIIDGVATAQEHAEEKGAEVAPKLQATTGPRDTFRTHFTEHPVQTVEFDVAVTASEVDKAEGTIGILVASLGVGVKGSEERQTTELSRIKFSVPIGLPGFKGRK